MSKKRKTKWLYRFEVEKNVVIEEDMEPSVGENGEEIVQKKKTVKKVKVPCALLKPSRRLFEDGELYYSVILSKYIQSGLITKQLLAKRFQNDGGTISEDDKNHYANLYAVLAEKEQQVKKIQIDTEMGSKEKSEKLHTLFLDMATIRKDLVDFEGSQSSLFDQTAEHKAKNKAIMWWVLMMSYWKDEGTSEMVPLFGDGEFKDREELYDIMEEEVTEEPTPANTHFIDMIKKFSYYVAFWFSGQATDKDSFDEAGRLLDDLELMDATGNVVGGAEDMSTAIVAKEYNENVEGLEELEEKEIKKELKEAVDGPNPLYDKESNNDEEPNPHPEEDNAENTPSNDEGEQPPESPVKDIESVEETGGEEESSPEESSSVSTGESPDAPQEPEVKEPTKDDEASKDNAG